MKLKPESSFSDLTLATRSFRVTGYFENMMKAGNGSSCPRKTHTQECRWPGLAVQPRARRAGPGRGGGRPAPCQQSGREGVDVRWGRPSTEPVLLRARGGGHLPSARLSTAGPAAWRRWAEAWRGRLSPSGAGPACPGASTWDGSGWAEQRARVLCRSAGRGGELGLGSSSCQSGPPFPPTRPGPRCQPLQHTGSCCPCRRVLMGPEGLSADGLSRLLQQGQLCTPRGVLDPAVSRA